MPTSLPILASLALLLAPAPRDAGGVRAVDPEAAGNRMARAVAEGETVRRRLGAMGTLLAIEAEAEDRPTALAASEAAVRAIEAVEARLSTWRDDSELARLNAQPAGEPFALSAELTGELTTVARLVRETDGAFDPGVGALVRAWGLRTGGRVPSDSEIAACVASGGFASLELAEGFATRSEPGLVIEEGGFGKGVGLDAAAVALRASGATAALVDLGGQVLVLGRSARLGVADPRERESVVLEIDVDHGSVATSSSSERGIVVDGVGYSHVLDPRTGRPARDFGSMTVWAADATTADALSTGLFVMGPERALAWALEHEGIEIIVAEVDGDVLRCKVTPGWKGRLVRSDQSRAEIEWVRP